MAVRFDNSADALSRTATAPAFGDFTVTLWAYRTTDTGGNELPFWIFDGATQYIALVNVSDVLNIDSSIGTGTVASSSGTWTTGTWKRLGMAFDNTANTVTLYENGAQTAQGTGATGTFTPTTVDFGVISLADLNLFSGRVTNAKYYTAVLSLAEVENELWQYHPVRTANLWAWWPLLTAADPADYSGNGRDLTATTVATEDGPPIPWSGARHRRWYSLAAPPAATPRFLSLLGVGA
jgi:hypothetical protein